MVDPCKTDDPGPPLPPAQTEAGRIAGQVRCRNYATPWFDYLIASRGVGEPLGGTGWRRRRVEGKVNTQHMYVAVLEKD